MQPHYHGTIDHVLYYAVGTVVVINVWRIGAAWASRRQGMVGRVGRVAGALVTFGGTS